MSPAAGIGCVHPVALPANRGDGVTTLIFLTIIFMSKLHQLIAALPDRKQAADHVVTETQNTFSKKPDHFMGKHSVYKPLEDGTDEEEDTYKELVDTVDGKLEHCFGIVGKFIDLEISRDCTNQFAKADVSINGVSITPPLPATSLLMLESKIQRWLELFTHIPTLAPGRKWELDPEKGPGVYVDKNPEARWRKRKTVQHKELSPATQHHPAQIEKWYEDVNVGRVVDTIWCSMYSPAQKSKLISRAQELLVAVKDARQRANDAEAVQLEVAKDLFRFLLQ